MPQARGYQRSPSGTQPEQVLAALRSISPPANNTVTKLGQRFLWWWWWWWWWWCSVHGGGWSTITNGERGRPICDWCGPRCDTDVTPTTLSVHIGGSPRPRPQKGTQKKKKKKKKKRWWIRGVGGASGWGGGRRDDRVPPAMPFPPHFPFSPPFSSFPSLFPLFPHLRTTYEVF